MNALVLHKGKEEREMLREKLSQKGYNVTESNGGLNMLEDMSQFKKDVVVLDYETWRENRGVYRYFGVEKMWQTVPVLLISQSKRSDIFSERHSTENDANLSKPVDANELEGALSKIGPA